MTAGPSRDPETEQLILPGLPEPDPAVDPEGDSSADSALGEGGESAGRQARTRRLGRPTLVRFEAFRSGFIGALGVTAALAVVNSFAAASQVVTLVFAALFVALGLDPLVSQLERRGMSRSIAVTSTFVLLVLVAVGFFATIIPVVVEQTGDLASAVPLYIERIESSDLAQRLDREYEVFDRINAEVEKQLTSSDAAAAVFGGVLGAGRAVATGLFSVFTVLILTLYFLVSLRSMTGALYRLVPASGRPRFVAIATEAQRRVGGYVIGQVSVAALNGVLSFIVMLVLDVRYPVALAFAVGVLGLVPLVGATLGAILACAITALSSFAGTIEGASWWAILGDTIVLAIWFVIYQQVENYIIAPRIFARSVAVPGTLAVVAALIGGSLLGLLGALVAVPLAAIILLIIQEVVVPHQDRR